LATDITFSHTPSLSLPQRIQTTSECHSFTKIDSSFTKSPSFSIIPNTKLEGMTSLVTVVSRTTKLVVSGINAGPSTHTLLLQTRTYESLRLDLNNRLFLVCSSPWANESTMIT
jgi:hypothetical protein